MGIQESNLNNTIIKKILEQKYNIYPNKIIKIEKGTANIFKIDTDKNSYVLKEFSDNINRNTIEKEINIVNFLKQRNIRVPEYIELKNNSLYFEYKNHIITVQKFIDGYMIKNNKGTYEQLIESATTLGKIVKEMKDFPDIEENTNWCSKKEIKDRISKMKKLKIEIKDSINKEKILQALDRKIEISEKIEKEFDFEIISKMIKLNSHGDYNNTQLIFNHQGQITVIDFEKARKMPIGYELIEAYCSLDKDVKDGYINIENLIKYFQEFLKYVQLNKYDLKYSPYIFLIRLANSSYGYEEYNNDNKQIKLLNFAFFRTKLVEFLYENVEEISSKLKKSLYE